MGSQGTLRGGRAWETSPLGSPSAAATAVRNKHENEKKTERQTREKMKREKREKTEDEEGERKDGGTLKKIAKPSRQKKHKKHKTRERTWKGEGTCSDTRPDLRTRDTNQRTIGAKHVEMDLSVPACARFRSKQERSEEKKRRRSDFSDFEDEREEEEDEDERSFEINISLSFIRFSPMLIRSVAQATSCTSSSV